MKSEIKKIHFIGICGVAMSALALAFKENGWQVTGSDVGFYPPVSDNLKDGGIDFYPGWHPERVGTPNLVIVGNVAGSKNPEWLYVQEQGIPYLSYPEAIAKFLIAKNSLVCAGTYGKTTSSAIMSWIINCAGLEASHMFGGVAINDLPPAQIATNADWSVVEGDEYKSSRWDNGAKFFHYSPTHLLLTSVVWDHADIYPTEQLYIDAFQKLVEVLPPNGLLVVSEKVPKHIVKLSNCQIVTYGQSADNDYQYKNISSTKEGITFDITHNSKIYNLKSTMLGEYNADNITGCFALAHQIGIEPQMIIDSIRSFKGIKRRLELRHHGRIDVYDDIAHSPQKATGVLASLRKLYSGKIIAVFEPNTGNRTTESIAGYDHAFALADEVIIPRLTSVKIAPNDPNPPFDGAKLTTIIAKTHPKAQYIDGDEQLVNHLVSSTQPGDCIVFLGSHGFRGMIEELCIKIK